MKLINLTYRTNPEEIKQELAIDSFIEGLRDPETSQTLRIAGLKKIFEVLTYALYFEIAKQILRNREIIIRSVNVSRDYRKIYEEIFMKLMGELQEFLIERKIYENKNTIVRSRNRIRYWKCGQEGQIQSHCTCSTVPDRDPDGYGLYIANIGDEYRRSDLEKVFALYGELKEVWGC